MNHPHWIFNFLMAASMITASTNAADPGVINPARPAGKPHPFRDFGGIPATLLKHPDLKIRTLHDEHFMAAQTRYLEAVAKVAKPFLSPNGGLILMTQLENESGSHPQC